MKVFGNYSRYYDLLYRDKDYATEAKFVHDLIQEHKPDAQSILELGCGTGRHSEILADYGYHIHGVDLSEEMLQKGSDRLSKLPPDLASRLKFFQGDIRNLQLNQKFDVIVSLFHVISYQTTNDDLLATFHTVKTHLKQGGIFIFDCWYGAGVLSDPPTVRVKRLEDETMKITRIAEPIIHPNDNLVDVNYQVFIEDKNTDKIEEIKETHTMRYLFKPEIEFFLKISNLTLIETQEWMSKDKPSIKTWNIYFIGIN
jgi:SAM-dependent methyltransferase